MTTLNERTYVGDIVQSEPPAFGGRALGTLLSGTAFKTGAVLGQITNGGVTSAAKGGGNTGNGVVSALSVQKNVQVGVYKARVEVAGTNAATWNLYDPNGNMIDQQVYAGSGATAVFANSQIHGTITDGATDFVVGDGFDFTVAAGSGKYKLALDTNLDGSQNAAGILLFDSDATSADFANGVMLARGPAVIDQAFLTWDAGVTTSNQKTAILAALVALGIKIVNAV